MRLLFYSHDGLGLGHVRRHLAIASAVVEACPSAQILLATSIDEVSHLGLPSNVDTLKLPGLKKLDNNVYAPRRLGAGLVDIHGMRIALLNAAVKSFRPNLVLVDKHPLGVGGEFLQALELARGLGARTVLGLRDILDDEATVRQEWFSNNLQQRVMSLYDSLLIYGSRGVFDPLTAYNFDEALCSRAEFCGYVVNRPSEFVPSCELSCLLEREGDARPVVIGTTGGGEDGAEVLQKFITAAGGASWRGAAVAGPLLEEVETRRIARSAAANDVALLKFVPSLSHFFSRTAALVCMGGYNTLVEAAAEGVPAVCIPRISPRSEQLLRAQRFEQLGLLQMIDPRQLTPERLRKAINKALQTSRQLIRDNAQAHLNLNGAAVAASKLIAACAPATRDVSRFAEARL